MKKKILFAMHNKPDGTAVWTNIAEGTTADFADPKGFIIVDSFTDKEGEDSPVEKEINGAYPVLKGESFRHLEGKLLTLCDATFTNKEQREAFKKMITSTLWSYFHEEVQESTKFPPKE